MVRLKFNIPIWKWATAIVVFVIGYDLSKRVEWRVRTWERDRSKKG